MRSCRVNSHRETADCCLRPLSAQYTAGESKRVRTSRVSSPPYVLRWLAAALLLLPFLYCTESAAGEPEPSSPRVRESPITERDRDHWSFAPIQRPSLPPVQRTSWPQTPIDYFVLHRLEQAQLAPAPSAERTALLRRVKFDLLGLPPTPSEVSEFLADTAPGAYRRLVDRFLSSPAYGERWAQHWLDLARFAETDGFEHDKVRQDAWKYRQWVIDALNNDMPYDQFIGLQLTGDLSGRPQDAIATMFCMAGPDMPDINEQDLRRHDKLNEIASTVGASLLGLQMHCAQCHDHKFDPISQADFFRLRGVFEASVPVMKRDRHENQLSRQPAPISPYLYVRGDLERPGPELEPRPPRIACSVDAYQTFDTTDPRQAFIEWLFADGNPLAARVIANRIWQHHLGKSLTENPSDFGVIAAGPSHPRLLDWMATEMRHSRWSMKHLHRVILLSATYRQAAHPSAIEDSSSGWWRIAVDRDPENRLYSRFPRKRLEGEVIRDAMLAVGGQLNREYGGTSVMPPLPEELVSTLLKGQWQTSEEPADHARRSIYIFARRNLRYPLFDAFDRPDAGASCPERGRSTTAIQSLQMLNSDIALQAARGLRDRLRREQAAVGGEASVEDLVDGLFLIAFARQPSPSETRRVRKLLESPAMNREESLLAACLAVLNASEFVYVD